MTETQTTQQPENEIDTKIELLKYISEVNSNIKNEIGSDFILAKLEDQDKEAIIEMTSNAYFCKKIGEIIRYQAESRGKWVYNKEIKQYQKKQYSTQYIKTIQTLANNTFDAFLTRIYMTVILNRNKPNNTILELITGSQTETKEEEIQPTTIMQKIKKLTKKEEPNE